MDNLKEKKRKQKLKILNERIINWIINMINLNTERTITTTKI